MHEIRFTGLHIKFTIQKKVILDKYRTCTIIAEAQSREMARLGKANYFSFPLFKTNLCHPMNVL